jgi:membrane-bound lytic murein transglycosylase C
MKARRTWVSVLLGWGTCVGAADTLSILNHKWWEKRDTTFSHNVEKLWGPQSQWHDHPTMVEHYSSDLKTRTLIDFVKGIVRVEQLSAGEAAADPEVVRPELEMELIELFTHYTDTSMLLEAQFPGTAQTGKALAEHMAREGKLYDQVVAAQDGSLRTITGLMFRLTDNHTAIRREAYLQPIREACTYYDVSVPLTMAIMHKESAFNPEAISAAHAYGLMQIVPHSAGREAYDLVYGHPATPSPQQLLDPRTNIFLGVAYLRLLQTRYFPDLEDSNARLACVIAAYNAGPAQVRAILDRLTPATLADASQIRRHLEAQLPAAESRNYLPAVLGLLARYNIMDATSLAHVSRSTYSAAIDN